MKILCFFKGIVLKIAVTLAFAALNGSAMAYDFDKAWKEVEVAQRKNLPRTVTNKVAEIEREAVAIERWPDAAKAFLTREGAMKEFNDALPEEWIPKFAASVDAQPAPLQAVLQLHLAHTYQENSRRWRFGGAKPTKLDDAASAEKMPAWSPEKINATLEAQFEKVLCYADELKKMKLTDWSVLFSKGSFPESYCPTLYDFAIRDMIDFYGTTIPDKTLEKGLSLYDALIQFHRADGNLEARAMAEIGRAEYIRNFDQRPIKEREVQFLRELDSIMTRFDGESEAVAYAAWRKAEVLRGKDDLVSAHKIASEYSKLWPKSSGGKLCANVVSEIEAKEFSVSVERNWCAPWPEISVIAKNVEEVHFRLVPVPFDELVKDTSMGCYENSLGEATRKDKYLKRAPTKEWSEKIALKPDFTEQEFSFATPSDLKRGHYILFVAANGKFGADGLPLYCQNITVTSLALVLNTGNGKFEGAVHFAESGEPVEGASVELWGYPKKGGRFQALRESYTTDAEGRFVADTLCDGNSVISRHVRVVKDGFEVLSLGSNGSGREYEREKNYEHVDVFTDRAIYRPGQEIKVKGIAYHADPDLAYFHTHQFATVVLALKDPNGKEVSALRLKTNRWGSFTHTFTAPLDRLTGGYEVTAKVVLDNNATGRGYKSVNVEEYKRPKFSVKFDGAPDKATLGRSVTVTGKVTTYSGLPVQNAKVEWSVERRTRYPGWWSWFGFDDGDDGDGFVGEGESETDENGVFKVTFIPEASKTADLSGDPSFMFEVDATVTDETGEARSAVESFEIGTVAWRATVWTEGKWHDSGKPIEAKVRVWTLAGTDVPFVGTLKVFRLEAPERAVRKPADSRHYVYMGHDKGPWNWEDWEAGEEVMSVAVNSVTTDPWKGELKLGVGAYRLQFEAKDPSGKTVKDLANVLVFDPKAESLGIPLPDFFLTEKSTVKVGETLRAYWGSGYPSGICRVKVFHNGKVLQEKLVTSPRWYFELPIKEEHRGEIRIETTFVRENRIYHNSTSVSVPWDNKELKITAESFRSKLNPGDKETWKFKVSGPAEVLAFMYDRSLDAYRYHDVSLHFSNYFTPWTSYIASPSLQNSRSWGSLLSGRFKSGSSGGGYVWPDWISFSSRYGAMRMKMAMARSAGFGSVNDCDDMVVMECCAPAVMAADAGETDDGIAPESSQSARLDDEEKSKDPPPRRNLQETAFFFPQMETDADGNVTLEFTVPDALTGWKLLMVAHDNDLKGGVYRDETIVTTKPLMCEPNAPRFARESDDFLFAVKITNTEDASQKGVVSLDVGEIGDNRQPTADNRKFNLAPQPFDLGPHESKTFEFRIAIPDGCGYLRYVAKAKGENFSDGEEGVLPVLSRRILVREALQLNVRGNATKEFKFENLLKSAESDTIRHKNLTVRTVSRPAWYAVLSLPYLMEFPHECCEQTFSRYYANALGAHIANSDRRIRDTFDAWKAAGAEALKSPLETNPRLKSVVLEATPWMREAEHETAARARIGQLFEPGRLDSEQARCIEKLRLERNADGLWPWFPGGPSSDAITLYILTGFARLNFLAKTDYPDFFESALEALDREVAESVYRRKKLEKESKISFRVNGFDVRWLYLHSFRGVSAAKNESDAKLFIEHLRKEWVDLELESQALAAIALKRRGEEKLAKEIMASIKERGVISEELGMYWKRPYFFSCSVFAAPVSTQSVVIEAFREVTGDEESAEACNVWLLKQKQTQDWTTTSATADAIYALMLGGGTDLLAGDKFAEVTLGGAKVPTDNAEEGTGMYSKRYGADEISAKMGEITFTGAAEKGVSWGGVNWSYFEDVLKVRAHEPKELKVEKKYYKKVKGENGTRLTAIEGVLEPGDELVARLEITSDRTYEFVHLSDERPACAEPVDVLSSYRWRDGVGYYQSTRDTATHYYIDRLNKGKFVIETSFRVQQKGVFVGGIATIQCMYAPEFTAHSSAETIEVPPSA